MIFNLKKSSTIFLFILFFLGCKKTYMKNYNGIFSGKEIFEINNGSLFYKDYSKVINKLQVGYTEKQVVDVLGKPNRILESYDYGSDNKNVYT